MSKGARILTIASLLLVGTAMNSQVTRGKAPSWIPSNTPSAPPPPPSRTSSAPRTAARFTSQARFVMVPVMVRHSGQPVRGLTKDSFVIEQDGKEQPITSFDEFATEATAAAPLRIESRPVKNEFTNITVAKPSRYTIIVLGSLALGDLTYARKAVVKFLQENVPTGEPIALISEGSYGSFSLQHDFTTDPKILLAALKVTSMRLEQKPSDQKPPELSTLMKEMFPDLANAEAETMRVLGAFGQTAQNPMDELIQQNTLCSRVNSVRALARAYSGLPGRKSLIWISSGSPFEPPRGDNRCDSQTQRALNELVDANMAIYPIDARGLTTPVDPGQPQIASVSRGQIMPNRNYTWRDANIEDMQSIAEATGGRAYVRTNDIQGAIHRAMDDSGHYYLVWYRLPANTLTGWHKIHVKVAGEHLEIQSRTKLYVPHDNELPDPGAEITSAVTSRLEATDIPIIVRWSGTASGINDAKRIWFEISVLPSALTIVGDDHHMQFNISAFSDDGSKAHQLLTRVIDGHMAPETLAKFTKSGLNYNGDFDLKPGHYMVTFVVRDNLGDRIGSVKAPLDVN